MAARAVALFSRLVVGGSQPFGEWVVRIAILRMSQDRVLSTGDVRECALQLLTFGLARSRFLVVHVSELLAEHRLPSFAEYAV